MPNRALFFRHLGQTTRSPLALEIERADGCRLYDRSGKSYLDLISGIAVSYLGHNHPAIVKAVKDQADQYLHLMVYGELVQSPQIRYAEKLVSLMPPQLSSVYFVNSGAEAVDGAMKLAKKFTGRTEFISFKKAYHGSTHGPLSLMGDETLKDPFRPLLPDIRQIRFNHAADLEWITSQTAGVILEPVQGEAGVIAAEKKFFQQLRRRCSETGTLLILDEIQTAFGRTGKPFAFEHYEVVPDILCLAKGLGGGMPLGAFISSTEIMNVLSLNPSLGHITTFGGHPVCCAAGLAALNAMLDGKIMEEVPAKEALLRQGLSHPAIKEIRSKGLLMAVELKDPATVQKVLARCLERGIFADWFLFNPQSLRIAPPLVITASEIEEACGEIVRSLQETT